MANGRNPFILNTERSKMIDDYTGSGSIIIGTKVDVKNKYGVSPKVESSLSMRPMPK